MLSIFQVDNLMICFVGHRKNPLNIPLETKSLIMGLAIIWLQMALSKQVSDTGKVQRLATAIR